jgi:hypothetical protein
VEKQESSSFQGTLEEMRRQQLFVVIVDSTIDMTPIVLVLEPTVNDELVTIMLVVLAIQNFEEGGPRDAGNAVVLLLRKEMRKHKLRGFLDVHDRLQGHRGNIYVFLWLDNVSSALKHALRSPVLLPRSQVRIGSTP